MATAALAIDADTHGPVNGDRIVRLDLPDGTTVTPDEICDGFYSRPQDAPSYRRPPAGHAQILHGTSYSNVPWGTTAIIQTVCPPDSSRP